MFLLIKLNYFLQSLSQQRQQFTNIKNLKESLTEIEVVVHVDCSEDYTCKWNKEIKDTHFGGSHQKAAHRGDVLQWWTS